MKVNKIEEQNEVINHINKIYSYGDVIPDSVLAQILNYRIDDRKEYSRYINMMYTIKNKLIKHNKILKRIENGYYILKPSQISRYCYRKKIHQAHNLIKKSSYILENVDDSFLQKDRIEELENIKYLSFELDVQIQSIIETSKYYSRMDYYNNLND